MMQTHGRGSPTSLRKTERKLWEELTHWQTYIHHLVMGGIFRRTVCVGGDKTSLPLANLASLCSFSESSLPFPFPQVNKLGCFLVGPLCSFIQSFCLAQSRDLKSSGFSYSWTAQAKGLRYHDPHQFRFVFLKKRN